MYTYNIYIRKIKMYFISSIYLKIIDSSKQILNMFILFSQLFYIDNIIFYIAILIISNHVIINDNRNIINNIIKL